MDSSLLLLLIMLLGVCGYIYYSMTDTFKVECTKNRKLKTLLPKGKYMRKEYEPYISKVNAFNKLNYNPMPNGSFVHCELKRPQYKYDPKKELRYVDELLHGNYLDAFSTKPIFL